ncbi:MlaD family protein [Chryseosolibacter indicus]|uniref:MCE family protein n=1 Tax=Chryseosolibacter indicus TaxID=2782351 RepID=A0ABS5VZT5_9BACT|nr:MlaD family protein [Chryseosolibacter indicus]MBT1705541.1 MCE family protein [Chryseosolibacter indicus]
MKLSKELKVGLFMIVSIVLLYFGFNFLKGIDFFSSDNKYYAIYRNVDKLTESNLIYLNGYSVGRVSDIQIQQDKNRVVVELSIDSEIKINKSSIAVLNGELLGGRFIQLVVGASPEPLSANDTIRSDVAKGLAELIAENAEPVAANLQTTLKKLNTMLDTLNSSALKINYMLSDLRATPKLLNSTISSVKGNVGEISGTFQNVGTNLNSTLSELKPTIQNFRTISDSLKQIELSGTINKTQQTLAKINETLSKLNSGKNTVSKLMTEDSLYVNLNTLLNNLDSLTDHFNSNPRHFMAPLGKSRKKIEKELEEQRKAKKN